MTRKTVPFVVGVYVLLLLISIVPVFTSGDALSGIFALLLTLPWSVLTFNAIAAIVPGFSEGAASGLIVFMVGGVVNAILIYLIARWLVRRRERRWGTPARR
jgi:hypothetical protein